MYSLPYDNYPAEKIASMLRLNLETPIKLIEECVKAGTTRIVNNASVAAYTGHPDIWYGMTKAALINATKSFSKIYEGKVIINAVAPQPHRYRYTKSFIEVPYNAIKLSNYFLQGFGTLAL